jgi:hypothetical protein
VEITEPKLKIFIQKIFWIGPPELGLLQEDTSGALRLVDSLDKSSTNGCQIIFAGSTPCKAIRQI